MPIPDKCRLLQDVGVAFALLTRLPLPRLPDAGFADQARAAWAFALVGLVVGGIAGLTGWLALMFGLPGMAAAGLVRLTQVMLTGAMHEDGLADTADGFWGGSGPARRLEIMGDSRIGTYGVLALILSLGLRWVALTWLLETGFLTVIIAAMFSRALMPLVMAALPNARADGLSRGVGRPGWSLPVAVVLGVGAAAMVMAGAVAILPLALAGLGVLVVAALAHAKIGGQTGDILGASQQVAEVALLLGFLAVST